MATTIPPPLEAPQQPGCWAKHWKKIIGCGCLTILGGGAAFFCFIFFVVVASMKSSDAFKVSLDRAQSNPEVTAALGTPVKAGMMVGGSVNRAGESGEAKIDYSISGPKGEGKVYVEGVRSGGEWRWSLMEVKLKDGHVINLIEEPPPLSDQPEEPPPEPPVESPPSR
jgi:hypothetical protein